MKYFQLLTFNFQLLTTSLSCLLFASCVSEDDGLSDIVIDPVEPYLISYIRFDDPDGENVMFPILAIENGEQSRVYLDIPSSVVDFEYELIRKSDNVKMNIDKPLWYWPQTDEEIKFFGPDPVLQISLMDMDVMTRKDLPLDFSEAYTFVIKSKKLNIDPAKRITWTVEQNIIYPDCVPPVSYSVYGMNVVKCEVDGVATKFTQIEPYVSLVHVVCTPDY